MSQVEQSPVLSPAEGRLRAWGVIRASGSDARTFLHGQFSNDLEHLQAGSAQWTAYCTAKGRMLAGFLVAADGADGYLLLCNRGIIEGLLRRLRMFVLRAKVVLEDASERLPVCGRIGGDAFPAPMCTDRADDLVIGLNPSDGLSRAIRIGHGLSGEIDGAWNLAMIRAGEPWIVPATQEQFVPQMVNFDALGGINFRKGCYPGQEVVARAHYRGAVKRRMRRALVTGTAKSGTPLFSTGEGAQECGLVANAAPLEGGRSEILAVVPIDKGVDHSIALGSPDGPRLEFASLPYSVQEAA